MNIKTDCRRHFISQALKDKLLKNRIFAGRKSKNPFLNEEILSEESDERSNEKLLKTPKVKKGFLSRLKK